MRITRRAIAGAAAAALTATGLSVLSVAASPAHADTAHTEAAHAEAAAAEIPVTAATLTWGLSGYAQKGIFGPWTFKDLTGDAEQLTGSVSGGSQTEYAVDPVPATSMPASSPQKTPNAVRFSEGTGTKDSATGDISVTWDGSYTVNAYPPQFNAPNEIYSDPQLSLDAEGNGTLTMGFALGAGVDMAGNPTPAQDFGRLPLLRFSEGSVDRTGLDSFRATPDYQGITVTLPEGATQTSDCTTDNGATGWWGSWPQEFIDAIPGSVRPHFYSSGCGGNQDLKPALPVDVDLAIAPTVTVSDTELLPSGVQQVTVSGKGFDPSLAVGTRPPLAGSPAGAYVVFGRFAETWRPSAGAAGSTRTSVSAHQQWVTPGGVAPGTAAIAPDGSWSVQLTVDKAALDALSAAPGNTNYGIYTYPGSGAVEATYETYTPLTFVQSSSSTKVQVVKAPTATSAGTAKVTVDPADDGAAPTGDVQVQVRSSSGAALATTSGSLDPSGVATVALAKRAPGSYTLLASYAGDVNIEASTGTAPVKVAAVASRLSGAWTPRKPTGARPGGIRITVRATGARPTGPVTIAVKNAKGRTVKSARVSLTSAGTATFALPKLPRGTYLLAASYAGNSQVAPGRYALRFVTAAR